MAKAQKAYKVKHKVTPITRLSRMKVPFKMVGDPPWRWQAADASVAWESRQKAVYAYEMERRGKDSRGWDNALYYEAEDKNTYIDTLLTFKWRVYETAMDDNFHYDIEQAERDKAAWEYEKDNFIL